MNVRFGFMGSGRVVDGAMPPPAAFGELARRVDELGYDSLWVGDHLSTHNPVLDSIVALTHFASITRRVALGTGILLLPLRHPSLVAKQVATLDWLSGGRVILGVGVGGEDPKDFESVQVPTSERGARTSDGIRALRALWSSTCASYSGTHYRFADVGILPQPVQSGGPPIWVGARSAAALRRTGRLGDAWYSYMVSPRRFADGMAQIRSAADAAGRESARIGGALLIPTRIGASKEAARRDAQEHLARRYAKPYEPHVIDSYCAVGTAAQVRERLGEYADVGVDHVVFMPAVDTAELNGAAQHIYEEVVAPLRRGER